MSNASPFSKFIGIDYSGAGMPESANGKIRVFVAGPAGDPVPVLSKIVGRKNLSRNELRSWLARELSSGGRTLVGIDHAFSLPQRRLEQDSLMSWEATLECFQSKVRTQDRSVEDAKADRLSRNLLAAQSDGGFEDLYRLTERRCGGAKSVFDYDGPGVAHSTMAGIAQLALLREELKKLSAAVHVWPLDGAAIPSKSSAIVEIYPAIFKRQFERIDGESSDEHDARSAALWLREISRDGRLAVYLKPPLSKSQETEVSVEGWILGVM